MNGPTDIPASGDALEVTGLTVRLGRRAVINDLSFRVPAGSTLAVIGPNGSGKTVLLKALIGALPWEGSVQWAAGTRIGYVPQKLDIERDLPLTGFDLLRAKARVTGFPDDGLHEALELVNLAPDLARCPIGTLSGGQFQRLLLAFALQGNPNVLLFDEPTAGIDEPGEEGLYERMRRLQQERTLTLVLVSHELSLVYRYASSVLCLGRAGACSGPPEEILTPERLQEMFGLPAGFHLHQERSD